MTYREAYRRAISVELPLQYQEALDNIQIFTFLKLIHLKFNV